MADKQRSLQRLKPLSASKTEVELPPNNSSSTKSATPGRIQPKTVPAQTLLKEKARIKLYSAEKKNKIKTYTGQRNPVKTINSQNASLSNSSSMK